MCTHGHKRKYVATESRPKQRVHFTGCLAGLNINEQNDSSWRIGSKVNFDHRGHDIRPEQNASYSFTKNITKDDEEFVENLAEARAPPRKIADVLSSRTGSLYKPRDITNLLIKLKKKVNNDDVWRKIFSLTFTSACDPA